MSWAESMAAKGNESEKGGLQHRRMFGEQTLSTSSRNVRSPSCDLKAERKKFLPRGVVNRREERGGRGGGRKIPAFTSRNLLTFPYHPLLAHYY